jgi:hypothetical protein
MVEKKPKTPSVKKIPATLKIAERVKTETLKDTFIGKELLQASVVQRELTKGLHDLNANLKTLDSTLNLIREHEFVEFHKSKWKIFAYQILLGILFAIGTVFGLAILSWMTYTFFKDSEILKGVVNNQLKMRQFDFKEIRDRAIEDVNSQNQ